MCRRCAAGRSYGSRDSPRGPTGAAVRLAGNTRSHRGAAAARAAGLNILAQVRQAAGSLDRVRQVIKVVGFVNVAPGMDQAHRVVNGCSDLMVEVFGDAGRHARSAVGTSTLPMNIPVEIEAVFELDA